MTARSTKTPSRRKGFTFIELITVIVLMALLGYIILIGVRSVDKSKLRSTTRRVVNAIQYLYDLAVVKNRVFRLTFDLEQNRYWVEVGKTIDLKAKYELIKPLEEKDEDSSQTEPEEPKETNRLEEIEAERVRDEAERHAEEGDFHASLNLRYEFKKVATRLGKILEIPAPIRIRGIRTAHDDDLLVKGQAFILFFPNGFAERAFIYLEDDNDHVRTLVVQPLTGKAFVYDEFIEWDNTTVREETM